MIRTNFINKIPLIGPLSKTVKQTIDFMPKGELPRDVFESNSNYTKRQCVNEYLNEIHKFTIDDYFSLTEEDKSDIKTTCYIDTIAAAEDNVLMGSCLKSILDLTYGEGNYVYVSIGTSAAGIGRVMEFSGVETKYLPVSDLREILTDKHESKIGKKFAAYSNFLETQGLSPETIQKSPKQYLFFDYTAEGTSLRNFEHLLNKFCSIKGDNVHFYSLNETLEKFEQELTGKIKGTAAYVDKYLNKPSIAFYSGIPHLNIDKINKVKKAEKFESLEAKKYNFCVIDLLYKKGMLQKNSKNNKAL